MCTPNTVIKQAAYFPFGVGVGDHRPLAVDIDEIAVFGTGETPSSKLRARKLKLSDPRIIDKYKKLLDFFMSIINCTRR